MLRALTVVVAASVALFVADARAQTAPSAQLVYRRAAGAERCPDEDDVRSAVAARLGFDPFAGAPVSTITATLTRTGRVFSARIELRDASGALLGARSITSNRSDCSDSRAPPRWPSASRSTR